MKFEIMSFDLQDETIFRIFLLDSGVVRWETDLPPEEFEEKLRMWQYLYSNQEEDE